MKNSKKVQLVKVKNLTEKISEFPKEHVNDIN